MTSHLKTASLLLSVVLPSACGWIDYPDSPPPDDSTTTTDASDDGASEPTTGMDNKYDYVHFTCFNKTNYQVYPTGAYYFQLMHTCATVSADEPWDSDANLEAIIGACSATCAKTSGAPYNQCEDDGWASVAPTYGEPLTTNCNLEDYGPEYGGEVLWLDGAQTPERQVSCDLNSDCDLMFGADVREDLRSKGKRSGTGDDSAVERISGLELDVTTGTGRPLSLSGVIGYSTSACGKVACPLYLGLLDLEQTESAWDLSVDLGALGRLDKTVSSLHVQLGEPTLGIALADSQIAFPAGSLLLRIDVELGGAASALLGNGTETLWLRNPTAVVGRLVDGSLDLQLEVPTAFGAVKVGTTSAR